MPKKYRRNCDWCGLPYHGEGKKYCGQECSIAASRAPDPDAPPTQPDETIHADLTDEGGSIYVEASRQIKSHEELIERAGIDPEEWQITSHPIRTWSVPIKVQDEIHVVQMYYVGLTLRPKLEETWEFPSVEIIVKNPLPPGPVGSRSSFASLHFSDVHAPYHDQPAIRVVQEIADDLQPNLLACQGDLVDCEQISRFQKDPFNRTSQREENQIGARLLGEFTAIAPRAEKWFLAGNHEDRIRSVVWKKAEDRVLGELIGLDGVREVLSWRRQLGLDSMGWEFTPYGEHRLLRDKLVLCHGDAVRKHSGYSAKAEHDGYRKSGLSGHTHRLGSYYHTGYDGQVQAWHEMGCLCRLDAKYLNKPPNWQQGFAITCWDGDRYGVEHVSIHNGQGFFRGKLYGARVAA